MQTCHMICMIDSRCMGMRARMFGMVGHACERAYVHAYVYVRECHVKPGMHNIRCMR